MKTKMPYSVPEGYFERKQEKLLAVPYLRSRNYWLPYLALAASFLLMVSIGTYILSRTAPAEYASDEDIVEYLIDSGTTLAQIEEAMFY